MSKHILVTGGTGLLGTELTQLLLAKGHIVNLLSRKPDKSGAAKTYVWDIEKGYIDEACIEGVDTIIHLAGAGIAEERWTEKRKKELIESRTKSIEIIYNLLKKKKHTVKSVISASATGYYSDRGDELLTEESAPANDFLGECCVKWEQAVNEGEQLGLRVLKFRTGVVLSAKGGALPKLAMPVKMGIGSPLGNGKQWTPWIHHEDVVNLYAYGVENTALTGIFNMVAPNPVTNKQLTIAVAKQLKRPTWFPNVPAFMLNLLFGEMAVVVLGSSKVSAQKIENAGFKFKFPHLAEALKNIYPQ